MTYTMILLPNFLGLSESYRRARKRMENVREREIKFSENCKNYLTDGKYYGNISSSISDNK